VQIKFKSCYNYYIERKWARAGKNLMYIVANLEDNNFVFNKKIKSLQVLQNQYHLLQDFA